jgi:acyl-CoA synthetase (AMP-forming)/AMP-acid ligase II
MASNPLHGVRKPGSVGTAAGPQIAIMDESGKLLRPGETGEIVICGENVTSGYENNAKANAEAFSHGWFRTGDQGVMDAEGYVTLTGRLKEIINRGGEKVSPREVDEALMDHPAVLQVVTFAVPHDMLGEDVAAAVVLREGQATTEGELKMFLSTRIAAFKTPRKILFLAEIPKGATGKLQRIGLAQKLGLA